MLKIISIFNKISQTRARQTAILLFSAALLCYLPSFFSGIFLDDYANIYNAKNAEWNFNSLANSFKHGFAPFHNGFVPAALNAEARFFRPAVIASFKLDYIFADNYYNFYHIQNILLASFNTALLYLLWLLITHNKKFALLAAILFALSHANVFTIFWISSRTDLLFCFFALCALCLYSKHINLLINRNLMQSPSNTATPAAAMKNSNINSQSLIYLLFSLLFFFAALLSKETAAIIPAVIFIITFYKLYNSDTTSHQNNFTIFKTSALYFLFYLIIFFAYSILRLKCFGDFSLPNFKFYVFSPDSSFTSWLLFFYYAFQKLLFSFVTILFFLPSPPIKLFFYKAAYNLAIVILSLLLSYLTLVIYKNNRDKFDSLFILLISGSVITQLPTIMLIPTPHYYYMPSFFITGLAAWFFLKLESINISFKKTYIIIYLLAFLAASTFTFIFFQYCTNYSDQIANKINVKYDEYINGSYYKKTGEHCHLYLYETPCVIIPAILDFKLKHPEKDKFKPFVLSSWGELKRPESSVKLTDGKISFEAPAFRPYYASLFDEMACGEPIKLESGTIYKNDYYDIKIIETSDNWLSGNTGAKKYEVIFNEKSSPEEKRVFVECQ